MITNYEPTFAPRRSPLRRLVARDSAVWRLDWILLTSVLLLCGIGSLLVWSATRTQLLNSGADPQAMFHRQLLNIAIGAALAVCAGAFDYRVLRAYTPVLYIAACFALVAVLSPLGATINGSHSWIVLGGGFQFQPSELAKLALVVGFAMLLSEVRDGETRPRSADVIRALALAVVPMLLIMLQPDLGTTLVFGVVILGMLAVSGAHKRWIFGLVLGVALAAFLAIHFGLLAQYQMQRFEAFLNPMADPRGIGYNANQARIAVGSGGIFGKGLFQGQQTNGQFVPEQHTDFIFTVAGEELGFVGCAAIVVLFGLVLWRALRIAARAEDRYGTLVATGITCWFAFQAFENIGMDLGIMPITGLPLPFLSYGGSSMFATLIAVGLLMNIRLRTSRFDT
ncbi:MAG: rod shape-determining protein RodA [Streptosporangiaceae bacterium]